MIDEHAQAVLTLIDNATAIPVYDGKVPDGATVPYVVVYFDSADPEFDFASQAWQFVLTATVHCVGGNAQAARQIGDVVRSALLAVRPTVANRSCWPVTRDDGQPPQRDETTGSLLMDQIDLYTVRSVPG